jgi:hypothetical protein
MMVELGEWKSQHWLLPDAKPESSATETKYYPIMFLEDLRKIMKMSS